MAPSHLAWARSSPRVNCTATRRWSRSSGPGGRLRWRAEGAGHRLAQLPLVDVPAYIAFRRHQADALELGHVHPGLRPNEQRDGPDVISEELDHLSHDALAFLMRNRGGEGIHQAIEFRAGPPAAIAAHPPVLGRGNG